MTRLLCWLGYHRFGMPPHSVSWAAFFELRAECQRGCGARRLYHCYGDDHWTDKHPEEAVR